MIKKKYYCKKCKKYHILQAKIGKDHLYHVDPKKPKFFTTDEVNELYKIRDSEDYELFAKYSYQWNAGINPAGKNMAIYLANSNKALKQYLHFTQFGKKLPEKVRLYRVGSLYKNESEWTSFWISLSSARSYQKRMGANIINKYEAAIYNVIPSLSGAGEVYAKNVKLIKRHV